MKEKNEDFQDLWEPCNTFSSRPSSCITFVNSITTPPISKYFYFLFCRPGQCTLTFTCPVHFDMMLFMHLALWWMLTGSI